MPDDPTWADLKRLGSTFFDIQQTRKMATNRAGAAKRAGVQVIDDESIVVELHRIERQTSRMVVGVYRQLASPEIVEWQEGTVGIGAPTLAYLLGCIGHPAIAKPHHWEGEGNQRTLTADEPYLRTLAQLWSYCGHGDPERKKRKGMTAEEAFRLGNPRAKTIVWNMAVGCMKNRQSPYRLVYDDARVVYVERESWTPGHQMAAALRLVGKEILRDLWTVAMKAVIAEDEAA